MVADRSDVGRGERQRLTQAVAFESALASRCGSGTTSVSCGGLNGAVAAVMVSASHYTSQFALCCVGAAHPRLQVLRRSWLREGEAAEVSGTPEGWLVARQEVPLANAPIERVIVQLRFPIILAIEQSQAIAPFQDAVRSAYPFLRREQGVQLEIGEGETSREPRTTWRFHDQTESWRVSLGMDFVALETTSYVSRTDLVDRFHFVLEAVDETFSPGNMDRLGVRYIDRVKGDMDLAGLFRPEVSGVIGTELRSATQYSVSEVRFGGEGVPHGMSARWGLLPAGATFDPAAIAVRDEPTWVLDVDSYVQGPRELDAEDVASSVRTLAKDAYALFRWAVTDEFLRKFGGQL